MRSGEILKKEKQKTRWFHFEKVRILFVPKYVTITYEAPTEPSDFFVPAFALRYGPRPEHLVRKYRTLEQAKASGQKLAAKFGVLLVVECE